jgi:hypothetical protein
MKHNRHSRHSRHSRRGERGAVLIGAAIFLPVLLFAGFLGARYAVQMRNHLVAANMATVLVQALYQQCTYIQDSTAFMTCIENQRDLSLDFAHNAQKDVEMFIALYRKDPSSGAIELKGSTSHGTTHSSGFDTARFTDCTPGAANERYCQMYVAQDRVWVVEVFLGNPDPFTNLVDNWIYEVSLM